MSGLDPVMLRARHRDLSIEVAESSGSEMRVSVPASHARALLSRLRDEPESSMTRLVDLTAIDRGADQARLEVVYRLQSIELETSLRVHATLDGTEIDSVTSIWPAANWLEREVFDLFGIRFKGHPDLRRILLEEAFEGAPLRKGHPRRLPRPLPPEADE